MRYLLILLITLVAYSQSIPSEVPRDRKNTPASVVMYFDESDSTYHYLRIDSLSSDIITELETLNAKSFSTTDKQTEIIDSLTSLLSSLSTLNANVSTSGNQTTIIGHIDGIESLITTLNGYVDEVETKLTTLTNVDYSTSAKQDSIEATLNNLETLATSLNGYVDQLEGYLDGVETLLTNIDSNTDRNTTGGQGTQSVTTSAAALPSQSSKVVWLENQNSTGNIYWGYSSGVTTSNGMLLSPNMGVKIETDNLSDIYVIANSSLTIRYSYQN